MELLQTTLLLLIIAVLLWQLKPAMRGRAKHAYIIDSSVLIDGRILDIAKTGFLHGQLCIPSSVLREIQYLADNSDTAKRARARHGLDIVSELKQLEALSVTIIQDGLPGEGGVDERLIELCKKYQAAMLTIDFNLNKVAQAEGITVLNINELAQNLRTNYLPGEKRFITLVQKGTDSTQAVGYLEDGTMVVVDKAISHIGTSVEVEFQRTIQTQAGKMMFANLVSAVKKNKHSQKNTKSTSARKFHRQNSEERLVQLANKK